MALAAEYFETLAFLGGQGPDEYVKDRYVAELLVEGRFLAPGDRVELEATYLGRQVVMIE